MALGALGCSSVLPCRSRLARPRPVSYLGIVAFLSCWGCLRPFFNQPNDGGAGEGRGGDGVGSDDGEDAEAPLMTTKGAKDKQIHSNDSKNDDNEQLNHLTEMQCFLHSLNIHLEKIGIFGASLEGRLIEILSRIELRMATNRDSSTAPAVADATANKDAMKRMKGLLGSMCSIADKLPMLCVTVFLWLLMNTRDLNSSAVNPPAPNPPASEAGHNFKNPWMQVLITGNLVVCFLSFILLILATKLKDMESIDGVLCTIFIWLLLPVFLGLWIGLCMILHFFAHTPLFVVWPLGAIFFILSLSIWYWVFYKEQQKILKELNEGGVRENGNDALAQDRANSYAV